MIPTEHEYTAATHAAAKVVWDTNARNAPEGAVPPWDDALPMAIKRPYLEAVLPVVDAAISAIPDRAEAERLLVEDRIARIPNQEILETLPFSTIPEQDHVDDIRLLFARAANGKPE